MSAEEQVHLPELHWDPTRARSPRHASLGRVDLVVVHRWGVRFVNMKQERLSYEGVIRYFKNPANRASAHVVFPGSALPGVATQMVAWDDMAWAEAAYNSTSDEVESADAIWLGHDPEGMKVLARIVAYRLHIRGLPPHWSHTRGFCRHADLGQAGGGHTACPTTNIPTWRHFVRLVQYEHQRGGFRGHWGC